MAIVAVLCLLIVLAPGCAKRHVEKVAVYPLDFASEEPLLKGAPRSGLYRVQLIAGEKYLKDQPMSADRWAAKGEPLGFRADADGKLIAIIGKNEIQYGELPGQVTHAMWYHKSKEQTPFGKSMERFFEDAGKVTIFVAATAGTVGLIAIRIADSAECSAQHGRH